MGLKQYLAEAEVTDLYRKVLELDKKLFKEYGDWLYYQLGGDNLDIQVTGETLAVAGFSMKYDKQGEQVIINGSITAGGKTLTPTMRIKGKNRLLGKPCKTIAALKKELDRLFVEIVKHGEGYP